MCLRQRCADQVRKPLICLLLSHQPTRMEAVKITVRSSPERAKLMVGKRAYRNIGTVVNSDI